MSAFVVDRDHIDALITAALHLGDRGRGFSWYVRDASQRFGMARHELTHCNADEVGRMLWSENIKSVAARYGDEDISTLPGPVPMPDPTDPDWYVYSLTTWRRPLTPVQVLKAIQCYEYQSCEHGAEWESSASKAFCDALRLAAIHVLPGYEDAEWEVGA